MDSTIEQLLFLELTNKQFVRFPDTKYYSLWDSLSVPDKAYFAKLTNEIHMIYNYVNSPRMGDMDLSDILSIQDYDQKIEKVTPIILQVAKDYDLTVKNTVSEQTKNAIRNMFGQDFLDEFLRKNKETF